MSSVRHVRTIDRDFSAGLPTVSTERKERPDPKSGVIFRKLIAFLVLVVLIGGGVGFGYYTWFLSAKWDQENSKNIVIVPNSIDVSTNTILYASISYKEHKMTLQTLPANDNVEVPGGYGQYPLKSVFPLLGLDHKSHQAVAATYSYLLGVPIDEVWVTGEAEIFDPKGSAGKLANAVLFGKIAADLGLKDKVQLSQFIQAEDPDIVSFSSLADWQVKQGSRYAGFLKDCRVTLVNTTTVAGLGRKVTNVLERSGVTVVRLTDLSPTQAKSQITIQPDVPACAQLSAHIKQLFPDQIEVKQDAGIMNRSRSEAEVVVGQDLGDFLQ